MKIQSMLKSKSILKVMMEIHKILKTKQKGERKKEQKLRKKLKLRKKNVLRTKNWSTLKSQWTKQRRQQKTPKKDVKSKLMNTINSKLEMSKNKKKLKLLVKALIENINKVKKLSDKLWMLLLKHKKIQPKLLMPPDQLKL